MLYVEEEEQRSIKMKTFLCECNFPIISNIHSINIVIIPSSHRNA